MIKMTLKYLKFYQIRTTPKSQANSVEYNPQEMTLKSFITKSEPHQNNKQTQWSIYPQEILKKTHLYNFMTISTSIYL